jgi:DNA mismatch endonuclease (patch repair protein)
MMSGIRGKNTRPEIIVRQYLHRAGLRFRLHDRNLPGKPDLVFPKYRAVVQVHGCFWHQHRGCKYAYTPATNTSFWLEKLRGNVERDKRAELALQDLGWKVLTVWECQVSNARVLHDLCAAIIDPAHTR